MAAATAIAGARRPGAGRRSHGWRACRAARAARTATSGSWGVGTARTASARSALVGPLEPEVDDFAGFGLEADPAARPEPVGGDVTGDREEPGPERVGAPAQRPHLLEGAQERLGERLRGVVPVAQPEDQEPHQTLPICDVSRLPGMAVPPFGRFDDLIVEMRTRAAPGGWPRSKTLPIAGCHDRRLCRP